MDDLFDLFMVGLLWLCGILLVGIVGFGIADWMHAAEGPVVEKYYDDPDWVCSKTCTRQPECYTIVMGGNSWWNEDTCVSKETYDNLSIGDYFRE